MSIIVFAIFSILYTRQIIELSKNNSIIYDEINNYKNKYDVACNEGYINEFGIVTGIDGVSVNVSKSYSNMKGIGFKESLLIKDTLSCVTNKTNNMDKYILGSNPSNNSISIVIDLYSKKYYEQMISIAKKLGADLSILVNSDFDEEYSEILFECSSDEEFYKFYEKYNNFYCVKTNDYEIVDICSKHNINSILMINYYEKNLLYNIKHSLNKGDIIFIKENVYNLNELSSTIKYIKSRGINIVSINTLI